MSPGLSDAPVLVASDLRVVRGGRPLVRVEHFALAPGEVHVLLGANGAGKSTLLKALNGLEAVDGALEFQGSVIGSTAARLALRRGTAAVFQRPFLLATNVLNNVASGLRLRGLGRDAARQRAVEALQLLGIPHLAGRKPYGLSGGEAQRVSIARALAVDPAVLFLDEPLASLDPPARRALIVDLLDIFARRDMAVVWVTHDRDEAFAVGDRVSFLEGGHIVQTGVPVDVFAHPATTAFADFLGLDTYLEGVILREMDGSTRLRLTLRRGDRLWRGPRRARGGLPATRGRGALRGSPAGAQHQFAQCPAGNGQDDQSCRAPVARRGRGGSLGSGGAGHASGG